MMCPAFLRRRYVLLLLLAFGSHVPAAYASGPYIVDDADIAPPRILQNENWITHTDKGETLEVINGIYTIMPDTELTLQGTHDMARDQHNISVSPQD